MPTEPTPTDPVPTNTTPPTPTAPPRRRHRLRLRLPRPSLTRRAKRLLAWGTFSLAMLVGSGLLLADRLAPRASGAPSHSLPVQAAATELDRELQPLLDRHPGKTGVLFVADGLDAFAARALSARQAGRSLDLQYYIWHDDLTGRMLGREAWQAAERGVRVRILLDDINAAGTDAALATLDRHRNIEVRLYNPFRNRAGIRRLLEMAQRLVSLNHRMHNKAWIADGRVAVVGGRNIGKEYFAASTGSNFHDLDLVLFGPAVAQASDIFDQYWNSEAAVPLRTLDEGDDGGPGDIDAIARLMEALRTEFGGADAQVYLARVELSRSVREYAAGALSPIWTDRIAVVSDPPLKQHDDVAGERLVDRIERDLRSARRKALVISPYFVPGDAAAAMAALALDDVHVGVVTNSLAANDVVAVHGAYARYRRDLLRAGVKLYEIRPQRADDTVEGAGETAGSGTVPSSGGSRSGSGSGGSGSGSGGSGGGASGSGRASSIGASLHTKAYLVDDRRGFIGSFNMDPRSADLNTEMGVFFDDPDMAAALSAEYLHLASPALSYWTYLGADGELRWLDRAATPQRVYRSEPEADAWRRAQAAVFRWLPIESQL